ncbi:hypothetical protein T12_3766 [Trichinella patagoniensis]|uniref:Uncharacterized protein n=1 Tax=Trichinella patagoniensis TaxID=990121 RepID=A0A0V0Z9C7_9BILA|nr:hypothetical protein T12_3766 [Trichinella patagoniensis]
MPSANVPLWKHQNFLPSRQLPHEGDTLKKSKISIFWGPLSQESVGVGVCTATYLLLPLNFCISYQHLWWGWSLSPTHLTCLSGWNLHTAHDVLCFHAAVFLPIHHNYQILINECRSHAMSDLLLKSQHTPCLSQGVLCHCFITVQTGQTESRGR